jgi:hypothetical protein
MQEYYVEYYFDPIIGKSYHALHDGDVGTKNEGRVYASFSSEAEAKDWVDQENDLELQSSTDKPSS